MIRFPILSAIVLGAIAACSAPAPEPLGTAQTVATRPLDVLPADVDVTTVRQDLLATAEDRFGPAALTEARNAPTHLVVKRFAGMLPPPPPGETTQYVPPAALLARRSDGWRVATETGWRTANAEAAAELDRIIADATFWREAAYTPPCPDFGANLLLLKVPGRAETVRNSRCMSQAARLVEAALRA